MAKKTNQSKKLLTDAETKEVAPMGTVLTFNDRRLLVQYKRGLIDFLKNIREFHLKRNIKELKLVLDEISRVDDFLEKEIYNEAEVYYLRYLK